MPANMVIAPPDSNRPAPGPVPLRSLEQLHSYLCSAAFEKGGDSWRFMEDGSYRVQKDGNAPVGIWTTAAEGLVLSQQDGTQATVLPLAWVDGKFRIEIDGVQYMRAWDIIRDQPR